MDRGTPPLENARPADHPPGPGQGPDSCAGPPPQGGKVLELGRALARTIRHFFPRLNADFQALPDSRFQPMVTYDARFLCWWGLLLFILKLQSRRQLDFQLRDPELRVLENVNLLAGTEQTSLPVNKTLSHFLGHVRPEPLAGLRTGLLRRLMRNKVLDSTRLAGAFVIAVDGTGYLSFGQKHCDHCLVHEHESHTVYLHPVLEAKLVAPEGLALSIASEFIENPGSEASPAAPVTSVGAYEKVKQDCELKAFTRLAADLKAAFPQTRLCLAGDSLLACGPVLAECAERQWLYVLTLKRGRTPALWDEFQRLLALSPGNRLAVRLPDGRRQTFRWVNDLEYIDSEKRTHRVHALLCEERAADGSTITTFAWVTNIRVDPSNVVAIATRGGRARWKIENQGFNTQKNSGLNLEHAYSTDPEVMKAFYYLLQIAHLFLQMFEMGSLLRQLAERYQSTPIKLFGSRVNIAKALLEAFRHFTFGTETFQAGPGQIRLCDSG